MGEDIMLNEINTSENSKNFMEGMAYTIVMTGVYCSNTSNEKSIDEGDIKKIFDELNIIFKDRDNEVYKAFTDFIVKLNEFVVNKYGEDKMVMFVPEFFPCVAKEYYDISKEFLDNFLKAFENDDNN